MQAATQDVKPALGQMVYTLRSHQHDLWPASKSSYGDKGAGLPLETLSIIFKTMTNKQQINKFCQHEMRRLGKKYYGVLTSAIEIATDRNAFVSLSTKAQARAYIKSIMGGPLTIIPPPEHVKEKTRRRLASKPAGAAVDWSLVKSDAFLDGYEWRRLRMEVLKKYGAKCMCCNATREHGLRMHVDHIKPRKYFPELALTFSNLQVLCEICNHGKGNWDETDWRPREEDQLPDGALEHMRDILKH